MKTRARKLHLLLILLLLAVFLCVFTACEKNNSGKITVTFEVNGGSLVEAIRTERGESVAFPADPVRPAYVFTGWYYEAACTSRVNPNAFRPKANITIYAGWDSSHNYEFPILIEETEFAVYSLNKEEAKYGEEIILGVFPVRGYGLTSVTVTGGDGEPVTLTETTGTREDDIRYFSFPMPVDGASVAATYAIRHYSLTAIEGEHGTVYLDKDTAVYGESVYAQVVPNPGYAFFCLFIQGVSTTSSTTQSFDMPYYNAKITPFFIKIADTASYTLTVTQTAGGSIRAEKETAHGGEYVRYCVTPENGYRLTALTLDGEPLNPNAPYFQMPAKHATLAASFAAVTAADTRYTLTLQNDALCGTAAGGGSYAAGECVPLAVVAGAQYAFLGFTGTGNEDFYEKDQFFIMPSADTTLTATYAKNPIALAVTVFGEAYGMVVLSSKTGVVGDKITVRFLPFEGCNTEEIWINGSAVTPPAGETAYVLSATVTETGLNLSVTFAPAQPTEEPRYRIIPYDTASVTVLADKAYAAAGEMITVSVFLKGNAQVQGLTYSGMPITNNTFMMPAQDVTLGASLDLSAKVFYKITVTYTAGGFVSVNYATATAGTRVHLTASPESGYMLSHYEKNGDTATKYSIFHTFVMPDEAVQLHAVFVPKEDAQAPLSTKEIYEKNVEAFADAGLALVYRTGASGIHAALARYGMQGFAGSVQSVLFIENQFAVFALHSVKEIAALAQMLYYHAGSQYACNIFENQIVLSYKRDADEVYAMLQNGVSLERGMLFYARNDGSAGLYYAANQTAQYITVPDTFGGAAVAYIGGLAFPAGNAVIGLYLGSVREIGAYAFDTLTLLKRIDFSDILIMPETLLKECVSLVEISVASYNISYAVRRGMLVKITGSSGTSATVLRFPAASVSSIAGGNVSLDGIANAVGAYAFYKTEGLTGINLRGVTKIEDYAFAGCANLVITQSTANTFESVVSLGAGAFQDCPLVTGANLKAMRTVGSGAFVIGTQNFTVLLETSVVAGGASDPIHFAAGATGILQIRAQKSSFDALRQGVAWCNYGEYFILNSGTLTYYILYVSNGGSYIPTAFSSNVIGALTNLPTPTKEGYLFDCWCLDSALQTPYDGISVPTFTNGRLVLYARYAAV